MNAMSIIANKFIIITFLKILLFVTILNISKEQ